MNPSDEQPGPSWWPDDGTPYTPSKPRRSRSISNDNKTSKKSRSPSSKRNTLSSKRDLVTESTTISSTCNTPSTENRKGPRMSRPLKRERGGRSPLLINRDKQEKSVVTKPEPIKESKPCQSDIIVYHADPNQRNPIKPSMPRRTMSNENWSFKNEYQNLASKTLSSTMFNAVGTRPTFGVQQNSFGFGASSNTASPFGQTQNFMSNAANTGFNQTVGGFGSTTPMFGAISNPQSTAPLFGNTSTSTFGSGQSGFGTSLFGGNQQQPSTSGIFGNASSTFGQQNKATSFGFGQTQQATGLFGQAQPTTNTSLFQPSTSANVFGAPAAFGTNTQAGTVYKFVPVTGTDSMQKSGIAQTISTKHHCITCMKEYEGKSLEELRWEDYQANRRGPQQTGFTAQAPFGAAATTQSLFGQTENKPVFGQSTTFGQTPAFGMTSQPTTNQSMFGRPNFGTPTTTTTPFGFGTNTSTNSLFGNNQQNKFGQTTVFGQQQPTSTTFGTSTNIFAQNTAQNKGLFSTPSQTSVFGQQPQPQQQQPQQQSSFAFGQQTATQSSSLFSQKTSGPGFFGNTTTSTPSFGQQQFSFGSFGTNTFNKQPQNTFGQATVMPTFGTNLNVQNTSLFGNAQKQTGLFGNTNTSGSLFNNNAFQPQGSFAIPVQQQMQPALQPPTNDSGALQSVLQLTDPYGIQKCLEGLTPKKPGEITYATNPQEIQKILESPKYTPPILSANTKKLKMFPPSNKKNLFDDVYEDADHSEYSFRSAPKRLILSVNNSSSLDKPTQHLALNLDEAELKQIATPNLNLYPNLNLPPNLPTNSNLVSKPDNKKATSECNVLETADKEKGTETDVENTSGSYKYNSIEISVPSKDDTTKEHSHLNITLFDINKSLKEMTKYDAYEVNESTPSTSDGRKKDSGYKPPPKDEDSTDGGKKIDTCGVTFTRPDYYMIPPLADLHTFVNSDGRCIVTGLVIGRIGYGNVFFSKPIDLTNMNIDELVHFRYRELTIYPDNSKKPQLGEGLNQPAQVTLDCVFPKDRVKNIIISDVDFLIAMNFGETLRDVCLKQGTKFVDYRPDTGSWVFNVDHFSKYGFTDSDDEEASNRVEQFTAKQEEMRVNEERRRQNTEFLETYRKYGLGGIQQPPLDITRRAPSTSSATVPQQIEVQQTDFKVNIAKTMQKMRHAHAIRTLFEDDTMSEMSSTDVKIMEDHLDVSRSKPSKLLSRQKDRRPKVSIKVLKNLSGRVPVQYSLLNYRNYCDIAIFKGRSFKVGWGKGFAFTNIPHRSNAESYQSVLSMCTDNMQHDRRLKATNRYVQLTKINHLSNDLNMAFNETLEEYLQIAFKNSQLIQSANDIPLYISTNSNEALNQYLDLANEHPWINDDNNSCAYVRDIWSLCAALWGKIDGDYNRRELFSEWLEYIAAAGMYENLQKIPIRDVPKRMYLYMTCHRILDAAELARKNDMNQISLLITQKNERLFTKLLMNKQFDEWREAGITKRMNRDILKMYLLLAGHPVHRDVNICESLKWQKALAIHLWYLTTSRQSLDVVIGLYEESFSSNLSYSNYPMPPYGTLKYFKHYDMQFHLMKLYTSRANALEKILNTFTHTSDPTDYRLAWLLLHSLSAFGIGRITEDARNHIHTSFAFQLENMGLYKWAVFVLMFIKDINVKTNLIRGVLERNLCLGIDETNVENELVKELKIPLEFLHIIKSDKSVSAHNKWSTYKHLTFSQKWNDVHDLLTKEILPSLFINEYYDVIDNILTELDAVSRKIIDWRYHGGAFLDFVNVRKAIVVDKRVKTNEEAQKLYSFVNNLCKRLTYYRPKTALESVCCAELFKHSIAYFKTMKDILGLSFEKFYQSYDYLVDDFKIPHDYRIEDAIDTVNKYYFKSE